MQNLIAANSRRSNKYFLIAFGLVNLLGFTLLMCSVGLLMDLPISVWQFPLGCILTLIVNFYAEKFFIGEKIKGFIKSSTIILALVIGSILFAACFFDISFDGQWYHQQIAIDMKQGYNPAYQTLQVPADEQLTDNANNWCKGAGNPVLNTINPTTPPVNLKYLNMNYFSKGTETIAASIYLLTNRIETGKAVNIILFIASFFLCLALLYKVDKIGTLSKWLLAFILAFNPITINEILSFCVDGFMGSLLLCLLVAFCLLLLEDNRYYLLLLGIVLMITVDVKYTALVFAGMYSVGFLIVLLLFENKAPLKKMIITAVIATVVGIFCCGFNPYVTNFVKKHDVFYGLSETRDEIARKTPPLFLGLNRFEKLFLSLSAHQDDPASDTIPNSKLPKIPFTFNKRDIYEGIDSETSRSGFGPMFSGSLCVAIVLFVIGLIYYRKTHAFKLAAATLLIITSTIIIMPDSWWMRFVPQLWLVPVITLVMAEFISFRGERILKSILYLSLIFNSVWSMLVIISALINTARIDYQMQQLKALNQPVYLELCNYRNFKSNRIRLEEAGIPVVPKPSGGHYQYDISQSTSKLGTDKPLPELPMPALLKLSNKVMGK
jgi:hypothetical protein